MSVLAQRYARGDFATFRLAHPYAWLVWEPGDWKPSTGATLTMSANPAKAGTVRAGESLGLALGTGPKLVLGRTSPADLEINDGTLSSRHLALHATDAGWAVEDLKSRNGTKLDGVTLVPGQRHPLANGARLDAANCVFTFLTPEGLWTRLRSRP